MEEFHVIKSEDKRSKRSQLQHYVRTVRIVQYYEQQGSKRYTQTQKIHTNAKDTHKRLQHNFFIHKKPMCQCVVILLLLFPLLVSIELRYN